MDVRYNIKSMMLDRMTLNQFKELVDYNIKLKGSLNYTDFNKNLGISKSQWQIFKDENRELKKVQIN